MQKMRDAIRASNAASAAAPSNSRSSNTSSAARATPQGRQRPRQHVLEDEQCTPVLLRDVARVELGPDERRGITD